MSSWNTIPHQVKRGNVSLMSEATEPANAMIHETMQIDKVAEANGSVMMFEILNVARDFGLWEEFPLKLSSAGMALWYCGKLLCGVCLVSVVLFCFC